MEGKSSFGSDEVLCSPPTLAAIGTSGNCRKFYGSNTSFSDSDVVEPLPFRLNQFRLKGIGCDIVFIVGDEREKFPVHKLVLGCSSPVFQAMFYGALGIASSRNNTIAILPTRAVSPFEPRSNNNNKQQHVDNKTTEQMADEAQQQQVTASNELSERFHSISTRDDEDEAAQQKRSPGMLSSLLFGDDSEEVEDAISDEEQYEEEETATEEVLCTTSSADCSLTTSSLSTYSNSMGETNSSAQNICSANGSGGRLLGGTGAPTSIQNGNGNPFDPQNASVAPSFPLATASSTSPPVKLLCTNLQQQQPWQRQQSPSVNNGFPGKDNKASQDSPTAAINGSQRSACRVHFAGDSAVSPTPPIICGSIAVEAIEVPDISPVAFGIMLDYIYNNYDVKCVELTDENVMHTLYAAKKYDLHSLVSECVRYLLNGLSPCNAVCLLAQARFFQEELLLRQCFEVIDKHTDTALQPANVADVDHDTLMEVLARSDLDPSSELVVFEAARSWAEAECNRRALTPSVENLRACLGPALQLIRFPLMSVKEFGEVAKLRLLTYEEIAEVYMHLTVRPRPFCRYPAGFRFGARTKHVVNRFSEVSTKRCSRRENKICFTTDRDIFVSALGIYGLAPNSKSHIAYVNDKTPRDWNCQVEIQLASVTDPCTYGSSVCHSATNNVFVHGNTGDATPCVAYFDAPVPCLANVTYVASVRFISEVTTTFQTYQGIDGKDSITVELPRDEQTVTFKFQSYRNAYGNDEGGKVEGQIPALHFLVQWPQESPKIDG